LRGSGAVFRLRPLSLFRYYEPQAIVASGTPAHVVVILVLTTVAALLAGLAILARRDL